MPFPTLARAVAQTLTAAAIAGSALSAHAADFMFSGNAAFNTDVVSVSFSLSANAADVRLWTDSWNGGLNFDPTATLWVKSGADYQLVAENDDDDTVGAGQGSFDSGLAFATLSAGDYLFTVGAAPNVANGTLLSQGFAFDGETPIAIGEWDQPSRDINVDDQKGTFWRINLAGVDMAAHVTPVPEPSTYALMALGLAVVGALARRRRSAEASHEEAKR